MTQLSVLLPSSTMAASSVFFHSSTNVRGLSLVDRHKFPFKHFDKQVKSRLAFLNSPFHLRLTPLITPPNGFTNSHVTSLFSRTTRTLLKCSSSDAVSSESQNPFLKPFEFVSFDSLQGTLSRITPFDVVKWSGVLSITIAAMKWSLNLFFNPFFWMYFSWTWLFWPWVVAITMAAYGLYCLRKHLLGEANIYEQLAVVTSLFTWLTLVPPAHFNGFLEGWPFVFFFVYHYFFFFNVSIRKRLYGDYFARPHDPKWDVNMPNLYRLLFFVGVMAGHWLAAFEGPELHQVPGGWSNVGIWILILVTLLTHYNSSLYLAKYSEKVVVPTAVVQFGPYRWVRHPIYASTMLLFAAYCAALRAPVSMLFTVAVCSLYYGQKAKSEEALMVETFAEGYVEYANKVKYKFIPFVY
ncbi:uncharacterized protein LOC120083036 isoform X1 [Benincasa hispida]|uniref:uncharacterized protein LOC120083036 isoform X1 n=1 Tax=Benincasa hispida TaxID=102211 RepID=UPI00190124E7|nr:uncharacterized protein LOC120083036 isoform X1 [Benincasa hispida]